jgi:hypothetical protein
MTQHLNRAMFGEHGALTNDCLNCQPHSSSDADLTSIVEKQMRSKSPDGQVMPWLHAALQEASSSSVVIDAQLSADNDYDCRLGVAAKLTGSLRARVQSELQFTVSAGMSTLSMPNDSKWQHKSHTWKH